MFNDGYIVREWEHNGLKCQIGQHDWYGHHCGYVTLPEPWFKEPEYEGFIVFVPVYGGVTFKRDLTYGFDTAHVSSDPVPPIGDIDWVAAETERLAGNLAIAREFEPRYLSLTDQKERLAIASEYRQACDYDRDTWHEPLLVLLGILAGTLGAVEELEEVTE